MNEDSIRKMNEDLIRESLLKPVEDAVRVKIDNKYVDVDPSFLFLLESKKGNTTVSVDQNQMDNIFLKVYSEEFYYSYLKPTIITGIDFSREFNLTKLIDKEYLTQLRPMLLAKGITNYTEMMDEFKKRGMYDGRKI